MREKEQGGFSSHACLTTLPCTRAPSPSPLAPRLALPLPAAGGFSILEILVAATVLILVMGIIFSITVQTSGVWKTSMERITAFQDARTSFDTITRHLAQAMLNTYWDYDNPNQPTRYTRQSELHFVTGPAGELLDQPQHSPGHAVFFVAPSGYSSNPDYAGLRDLLNGHGYFVEFNDDSERIPDFLPAQNPRHRYRLMEFRAPTESLHIYNLDEDAETSGDWFRTPILDTNGAGRPVHVIAENIILFAALPKLSPREDPPDGESEWAGVNLAPGFRYDSRNPDATYATGIVSGNTHHQLPPLVDLVMIAIDEISAARLAEQYDSEPPPLIPPNTFTNAARLEQDLAAVVENLAALNINYRIFSHQVSLRGAKWSHD